MRAKSNWLNSLHYQTISTPEPLIAAAVRPIRLIVAGLMCADSGFPRLLGNRSGYPRLSSIGADRQHAGERIDTGR